MKTKYSVLTLSFLVLCIVFISAYLLIPNYFQSLDSRIRDFTFKYRGPELASDAIVIVDIDEKSIKALGQWPWERNKIAQILENLRDAKSAIIGLDIIFSERDKTSPSSIGKAWDINTSKLPDYDAILARTVATTPTILGYVFDFNEHNENEAPEIPAVFIQKNKPLASYIPEAQGVLTNIDRIQKESYSSGYMNNIPDESGMIRSVPLLIEYDMQLYPSLAFEMYRLAIGVQKITVNYSQTGVENITLSEKIVKCDRFSRLYVNFRGPFKSYKYISAVDVYNNRINQDELVGKFILIGTSAYGLMDLRSTPMDSVIPGVEIHANVIDNLLNNDMLYKPSWIEVADIGIIIFITFFVLLLLSRLSFIALLIAYTLFFIANVYFFYYVLFVQHIILNLLFPIVTLLISLLSLLSINYIFESRQKDMIKGTFSKKVSKQVMEDLLLHLEENTLSSKEVNATIYFSDIRSFTTISEKLKSPQRIIDFLNFYMNAMVVSIEKNSGTIDKFIGDAVMAYWNAPLKLDGHADKAVRTALEQIAMRDELNKTIRKDYGFDVDYGIGINSGNVVVGEVGSKGRSDYTIIGDAVNLASRLEGLCKVYRVRLVVSEFTLDLLKEKYIYQILDIVRVKGKTEPVKIYEIQGLGVAGDDKNVELKKYEKAHTYYMNAEFSEAKVLFANLYEKYEKYLYHMYLLRCDTLLKEDISGFDGVFEFKTK